MCESATAVIADRICFSNFQGSPAKVFSVMLQKVCPIVANYRDRTVTPLAKGNNAPKPHCSKVANNRPSAPVSHGPNRVVLYIPWIKLVHKQTILVVELIL